MITAGLAPGCPAPVHRLLAVVMGGRDLEPLSWSPLATTLALVLLPALLAIAGIWCWRRQLRFSSAVLLLAMYAVHPPNVLPMAALYPRTAWRPPSRFTPAAFAFLFAAAAALLVLAPDCAGAERPGVDAIARDTFAVLGQGVGALASLLAVFAMLTTPRRRETRLAASLIGLSLAAVFISPTFDRRMTLVPAIVGSWWLAGRSAYQLIGNPRTSADRAATLLVLATIPVLTVAQVAGTAAPSTGRTTWSALSSTLAAIPRPAALVTTDAALSPWITAWRAGLPDGAGALAVVSPDSTSFAHAMEARGVFALGSETERLSQTGVVWGPVEPGHSPRFFRAVDYTPCVPLHATWSDVTPLAGMAQLTIRNSNADARTVTVVFVAQPGPFAAGRTVSLTDAGPLALRGSRLREFDLTRDDDRRQFAAMAASDGLDANGWLDAAGVISRVVIDHEPPAPALATLTLAALPSRVAARAERSPRWPGSLSICRAASSLPVLGYPSAPADVSLPLQASNWNGRGWHPAETEGDVRFRWTSEPRAEIRIFVGRPESYRLALGLMPIAGNVREALVVSANGRPLVRDSREPDAWRLPDDALHRGMNTLTLEAPVVPAPAPDPRRLGLKVRSIVLHRLATD
jgi:hypothetical protein